MGKTQPTPFLDRAVMERGPILNLQSTAGVRSAILRVLEDGPLPMGVRAIAGHLGLTTRVVAAFVTGLEKAGRISVEHPTGGYRSGERTVTAVMPEVTRV